MDIKELDDDQLDEHRRSVLAEQERRDKLKAGHQRIGAEIRSYLDAAGIEPPGRTDEELGQRVIDNLEYIEGDL